MGSGPVAAMVWEGRDAVKTGRSILGATNPLASAPGTIRGDYAIVCFTPYPPYHPIPNTYTTVPTTPTLPKYTNTSRTSAATSATAATAWRTPRRKSPSGSRTARCRPGSPLSSTGCTRSRRAVLRHPAHRLLLHSWSRMLIPRSWPLC
jgi:hypothetical protein